MSLDRLRASLPHFVILSEDPDILLLRCRYCEWVEAFSASGARFEEIVRDAWEHSCREIGKLSSA